MTRMRAVLALLVVLGFEAIVGLLMSGVEIPFENSIVTMLLGTHSTAFGMVLSWYFGSSSGSDRKSELLAQSAPAAVGALASKPSTATPPITPPETRPNDPQP